MLSAEIPLRVSAKKAGKGPPALRVSPSSLPVASQTLLRWHLLGPGSSGCPWGLEIETRRGKWFVGRARASPVSLGFKDSVGMEL